MTNSAVRRVTTPPKAISACAASRAGPGLSISLLPNGVYSPSSTSTSAAVRSSTWCEGSPLDGGIARLYLRSGLRRPPRRWRRVRRGHPVRCRSRSLRLGWRNRERAPRRLAVAAPASAALAVADRYRQRRHGGGDVRCAPRAGCWPRRARLPHEQRGLRLAVHRPPYRPTSRLRAGRDEPPEPGAGRQASLGRARLPRGRRRLRHRRDATVRPGLSRRRQHARSRHRAAERRLQHEVACP